MMKNQKGATAPSYAAILLVLAAGAWFALEDSQTEGMKQKGDLVYSMRGQAIQRINALQACYNDTRDWCDANDLTEYGLSPAGVANSVVVDQAISGDNVTLTVQAPTAELAAAFSKHVMNPVVVGSQVTFTVEPPTRSHILQGQVQRWEDPEFGRNTLEGNVLMDGNDIPNINEAEAQLGRFQRLEASTHTVDRLTVNQQLDIGQHTIAFAGNEIGVDADVTAISGDASVGGNVDLNGNDISGVNGFTGAEIEARRILSTQGQVDDLSGDRIEYTSAEIGTLNAYRYTSQNYTTRQLDADSLTTDRLNSNIQAQTGSVTTLSFTSGQGGNWRYTGASAGRLQSDSSNIGSSSGQSLALAGDLRGNNLSGNSAQYTSLAVLGRTTGGQFTSDNDFTSSRSSVNDNYRELQRQGGDISDNANAISQTRNKISSVNSQVSSNTSNIQDNADDIASNRQQINTNSSNITRNEQDIDAVSDRLGDSADELGILQDQLDRCMYQTQYCIPQDPSVSLSCPNCTQSEEQSNFSATASATITQCRQGCSYSWSISGDISGSCSSGTVPQGGNATPSCSVSKSGLNPQQRATGSITINVNNSHYTARTDSASVNVDFFNKTIPRPSVSTSCSGCSASRNGSNFSASISAAISNCPQGCSYSWSISGSASGSCPAGTVSAGSSASPSCNISGTVANSSTATGSVSITVTNSVSPSYSDNDSESYSWENRTPAFENCSATSITVPINLSAPAASFTYSIPALNHGEGMGDSNAKSGFRTSSSCNIFGQPQYHWNVNASCNDGVVTKNGFAECNT